MRVGFVVQRCGLEVNGGAETLCLQIAQRMARHWETEIVTTCALDYVRWENHYPEGVQACGETLIRRFRVDNPRDPVRFDELSAALVAKGKQASLAEQENWMRAQGPLSSGLLQYLTSAGDDYDAFIFFGYLYATTYFGLPLVKKKAWLAPLGHDEWPIYFNIWDKFFRLPRGFVFQTEEERAFLARRFPPLPLAGPVAGVGIDPPAAPDPQDFRAKYGLDQPFLLYVGRIDASKGCSEMFDWFTTRSSDGPRYKLVVIGREILPVPYHERIMYLGFVPENEKWNAMAACDWLILPSEYESLSISILEAWAVARPSIVNGKSEVLRGHCQRSHGGVWYRDWSECESLLERIDAKTMSTLGKQGQAYVQAEYAWERIEKAYSGALSSV